MWWGSMEKKEKQATKTGMKRIYVNIAVLTCCVRKVAWVRTHQHSFLTSEARFGDVSLNDFGKEVGIPKMITTATMPSVRAWWRRVHRSEACCHCPTATNPTMVIRHRPIASTNSVRGAPFSLFFICGFIRYSFFRKIVYLL